MVRRQADLIAKKQNECIERGPKKRFKKKAYTKPLVLLGTRGLR